MSELTKVAKTFTDEELNSITDINSAAALLGIKSVEDLAWNESPYIVLTDKNQLLGKKFLAVSWKFHESKEFIGNEFVSVHIITDDTLNGHKLFILNDGSAGICKQLRSVTDQRLTENHPNPQAGAMILNGLTLSEYDRFDEKGNIIGKGKTFYLS